MAHITGGGFYENIPRMFYEGGAQKSPATPAFDALITEGSWTVPPIFSRIAAGCAFADNSSVPISGCEAQKRGAELLKTDAALKKQMFGTFNMGIGFVLALDPADARQAMEFLDNAGFPAWHIGEVRRAVHEARCTAAKDGAEKDAISANEAAGAHGKGIVRFVKD
jgi:phosphoribosylformylglycinamidine cyclo-ligase